MSGRKQRSFAGDVSINMIFPPLMIVITLITVPLYLGQIGLDRYGVLTLVWALTGMFAFFDFGMGAATTYLVARARKGLDRPSVGAVILTTGLANTVIGALLALVFWLGVGPLVFGNIKTDAALGTEIDAAMGWIALLLPVGLVTSILRNAMDGQRRFLSSNLIGTGGNTATVAGTLAVAYWFGPDLSHLVMTVLIVRTSVMLVYAVVGASALRGARLMTWAEFREMLSFGGWQVVFSGISGVMGSADRFIIGWIAGAGATALYAIPMSFTARLRFLPEAIVRTLYPRLSEAQSDEERRRLGARAVTGMLAAMAMITIPAILVVRPFFAFWLGEDYEATAGLIAQILLLGVYVQSCLRVLFVLQRASGRPDLPARLRAVTAVPVVALIAVLVFWLGPIGAAIGLFVGFLGEFLWMLRTAGLLTRLLPQVFLFLFLCSAALVASTVEYGLASGFCIAGLAFCALVFFAIRRSDDIARLLSRFFPPALFRRVR